MNRFRCFNRLANFGWYPSNRNPSVTSMAGFAVANGRRGPIEADRVDSMVGLGVQGFYSMQIPVSFWFVDTPDNPRSSSIRERRRASIT